VCSLLHVRSLGPLAVAALIINHAHGATAPSGCEVALSGFGTRLVDARCTESADLTTANPATTPANNSIPTLPPFAFTPQMDRETIAPDPPNRTPIVGPVPGIQIEARIADDPLGQARILIRLPDNWNGRLVVAGAPGTRSEFSSDFAWSDYVVQKGYAYVSQNKGTLNFKSSNAEDATACRTNLPQLPFVHFYDDDQGMPFTRWAIFMAEAARLGRDAVRIRYGREARYTYAVGTSNGGYQVRRAVESYPELFDAGVDWEGTFVDAAVPNLLSTLPPAILNYPDYVASGFNSNSTAARNVLAAGYPPDLTIVKDGKISSLWGLYYLSYWEVTMCQWQKRLDPGYNTYDPGLANYVYLNRVSASNVAENLAAFRTTGRIRRPLITVAGTMDALLPIDANARPYARRVAGAAQEDAAKEVPAYRLYEVQNGNHIETYKLTFPQLEFIQPHAQQAFDLLVSAVENHAELPPSQCIPRGRKIETRPVQSGHCSDLLVP
jgi:3HB-oligomer hydrolase (3HBOH)/Tannase and feruloyl esterase